MPVLPVWFSIRSSNAVLSPLCGFCVLDSTVNDKTVMSGVQYILITVFALQPFAPGGG